MINASIHYCPPVAQATLCELKRKGRFTWPELSQRLGCSERKLRDIALGHRDADYAMQVLLQAVFREEYGE